MKRINENEMARSIAKREGGAVNLSIAQVKEVQRLTLNYLAGWPASSVMELVERHELDQLACQPATFAPPAEPQADAPQP